MAQHESSPNKNIKTIQKRSIVDKFKGSHRRQQYLFVYTCLLIPILFYLGIRIIPTLFSFNVGFRDWNLLSSGPHPLVGLENYVTLFKDKVFIKASVNTFIYIVLGVSGQLFFGIILSPERLLRRPACRAAGARKASRPRCQVRP